MSLIRRKYGLPFADGFVSSVKKIMVPPGAITADSRDWQLNAADQKWIGRRGSQLQGDVRYNQVGLLESKWSARARQILALNSPSMDDGEPTYAALYTSESAASRYGTVYARSTDSTGYNYHLGKEYGTTHYPVTVPAGGINYRAVPIPYNIGTATAGATGLTRGINALNRKLFCSGARRMVQTRNRVFSPSLYASPLSWNKRWNDATGSGSEVNRIRPMGLTPPLYAPTQSTETAAASEAERNFIDGDYYYMSVAFIDQDGNVSAPFRIRPTTANVTNTKGDARGGLFRIGTVQAVTCTYVRSVLVINIAQGPPGTVARVLLRTNIINASTGTGGKSQTVQEIDMNTLYIVTVIENNTATTFLDTNGYATAVREDPRLIRLDRIWPQPSRYMWEMEGRVCMGYRRVHLGAIILGPTGAAASRDLNDDDSADVVTNRGWQVDFGAGLNLNAVASPFPNAAVGTVAISVAGSLQDTVDIINETLFGGAADEWGAQLVPGVDGNRPASDLAFSTVNVAGCTSTGTTLATANSFAGVAVGMKARDLTSGTTAYVTAKASETSLTLDANIGSAGTTVRFSVQTGDDATLTSGLAVNLGMVRAFNAAFPVVIPLKASAVEAQEGYEDKQEVLFTQGSLGMPGAGPENFTIANRRKPPATDDAGILMGGAPADSGSVVCYSKAIYVLENRKDGNTGEDRDFRLYPLNTNRGCIAWDSIAFGDGWVGYLTREGYVIAARGADGRMAEHIISGAIWNPATREGEWDYEIQQCATATEADTDGAHFHAAVIEGALWISYRSSGSVTIPDRLIPYDFSAAIEGSGSAEALRPDGKPWPWGAPQRLSVSVMGSVDKSTGRFKLGAIESNAGSTGDGRIDRFDSPSVQYDDAESVVVTGCSNVSGQATITGGNFASVAVGAMILTGQGFADGTYVTAKNTAQDTLTMSANGTGFVSQSRTFYGKEIEPVGYCAMDHLERVREKKSAQRITALYRNVGTPDSVMNLGHSRDKLRTSAATMGLPTHSSGDEYNLLPIELPLASRSQGDVCEFSFSHDGRGGARPEFYGGEAEILVLDDEGGG